MAAPPNGQPPTVRLEIVNVDTFIGESSAYLDETEETIARMNGGK